MTAEFLSGNRLTLLNSGAEYFPALIKAIDKARHEVHLESYIFEDDTTGRAVAAAMAHAARRGVTVRVLVDGFGAPEFAKRLQPELLAAGVQVMVYRPEVARLRLRRHRLRRLHRKLAMVDGEIAFVGGINIVDDSDRPLEMPPRYDYAVRIEGPLLQPMQRALHRLWELVLWAKLNRRYRLPKVPRQAPKARGEQTAAFLVRDNIRHRRDIEEAYLAAIAAAREEILLANAYFLPGRRFRRALHDAARRGVRVILVLQGRIEYRLLHYATQALYGRLLGAGIRIFEYRRSFMHAKVAVIDRYWATVGSSNIDPFSLLLAREANVVVRDEKFARELRQSLQTAMRQGASELPADCWKRLPWPSRLLHWASYHLIRILVGMAGYGRKR
ncbi:MAG TPA: cardiolipin synthase ClsB [Accumulibacter sp.]|uniref:Cardiolipin synthase B n=2 Tax=Candidatus Accumulibacter TaxID=327159 RepID=A0A080MAB7_9PROT|nr:MULTISPECIES: cardiolipin synthase ClsB [Candidatus Accumulibacter]KFB77395.1 MAG: putative cardiolipin synthase YbhO [Candidatus Accumulibacter cognatus]MBL8400171.1 cardiolipin synthase ClsB [Accumulibacter sp.]MBN8516288.1 cardiolipin synthase ClsB [Accumulibacter sp.]MBO3711799.1 cardiolipin synthase ClsB [Accumulibacter sp.]MCC2866620.1 cardiolipin synthase ClsB [Candidatus Accumulibacter phosphatis]